MRHKLLIGFTLFILFILTAWVPGVVYSGNPPDQGKSTISGTSAPADGLTSSTVTIVLRDASGNTLSGNDGVTITSTNSTTSFNPSSVTLDGSGTIYTQMKSSYVGWVPVTVTDNSISNTQITGSINFYQPGTAPPTQGACTDAAPGSTPQLTSAVSAGPHSITLTWTDAANPVSYYLLSYGLSSGNYQYGNPNIGGQGTVVYTVGGLTTGTKYYFVIRAGNGCTPGNFSNEMSAVAGASTTPTPTTVVGTVVNITTTITPQPQTDQPVVKTDTPTPMPTSAPIVSPAPTGGSIVSTVVTAGTALGILIIVGIGLWVFINYRRTYS